MVREKIDARTDGQTERQTDRQSDNISVITLCYLRDVLCFLRDKKRKNKEFTEWIGHRNERRNARMNELACIIYYIVFESFCLCIYFQWPGGQHTQDSRDQFARPISPTITQRQQICYTSSHWQRHTPFWSVSTKLSGLNRVVTLFRLDDCIWQTDVRTYGRTDVRTDGRRTRRTDGRTDVRRTDRDMKLWKFDKNLVRSVLDTRYICFSFCESHPVGALL